MVPYETREEWLSQNGYSEASIHRDVKGDEYIPDGEYAIYLPPEFQPDYPYRASQTGSMETPDTGAVVEPHSMGRL